MTKTDEQKIEEAAILETTELNGVDRDDVGEFGADIYLFKAGVSFRTKNPSPAVMEVVRKLRWCRDVLDEDGRDVTYVDEALAAFQSEMER